MKNLNDDFLQRMNHYFNTDFIATILLDMDEVLAQLIPNWAEIYNKQYGDILTPSDFTKWDTSKIVKPECGMKMYELLKTEGIFRYLKPHDYAQEFVQNLIHHQFDVVIVSDSPKGDAFCSNTPTLGNPADDKRMWLKEYFPMIPEKNIFFGSQKFRVRGDILIDDKPETFEIFTGLGLDVILMDQPYNQHIDTKNRAKNLREAEKLILKKYL